ncbi:hypothetical protein BD410DRAFT_590104 [Rickenella mellea]|uniref:3'-5' exonuclease domain-containing protein n=1 Tax=Rickenella mellea TaxID=50990 RepID=A0A4Y7PNA4_9AGAM|nr:hypothetical protein BD410DRAFT_590104 [Rickenella mellea]
MSNLCDTPELVEEATRSLSAAAYIIIDCEGKELGTTEGDISLISLGTPNAEQIYLIDAVALDRNTLKPVLDLISGEEKMKIVWDGRNDYSELYHGLGAPICNVLDLQIADLMSRMMRGENEERRIKRLASRYLSHFAIGRMQCDGVHALNGLGVALQEHHIIGSSGKDATVSKMHSTGQSITWMDRPLPSTLISYASHDVQMIAALYKHFDDSGYLSNIPTLLKQSERYVSIHRDSGRPRRDDMYSSSNLLPLDVLWPAEDPAKCCDRCARVLSMEHFPLGKKRKYVISYPTCKVCRILEIRQEKKQKAVEKAEMEERLGLKKKPVKG